MYSGRRLKKNNFLRKKCTPEKILATPMKRVTTKKVIIMQAAIEKEGSDKGSYCTFLFLSSSLLTKPATPANDSINHRQVVSSSGQIVKSQ